MVNPSSRNRAYIYIHNHPTQTGALHSMQLRRRREQRTMLWLPPRAVCEAARLPPTIIIAARSSHLKRRPNSPPMNELTCSSAACCCPYRSNTYPSADTLHPSPLTGRYGTLRDADNGWSVVWLQCQSEQLHVESPALSTAATKHGQSLLCMACTVAHCHTENAAQSRCIE